MKFTEKDLVMLSLETNHGYAKIWIRVSFVDNDGTFIGKVERNNLRKSKSYKIGDIEKFYIEDVKSVYKDGDQFCYSDNVTVCDCLGLCREK